jgi:hypothetical protein
MPQSDKVVASGQPLVVGNPTTSGCPPLLARCPKLPPCKKNSSSYPHIFAQVVNSCWLATAHVHPAQTSPKIFKHP